MSEPKVGQVWQEVDPRSPRHVRIIQIDKNARKARIQTVQMVGDGNPTHRPEWRAAHPDRPPTYVALTRFTGTRGGFALFEDCP